MSSRINPGQQCNTGSFRSTWYDVNPNTISVVLCEQVQQSDDRTHSESRSTERTPRVAVLYALRESQYRMHSESRSTERTPRVAVSSISSESDCFRTASVAVHQALRVSEYREHCERRNITDSKTVSGLEHCERRSAQSTAYSQVSSALRVFMKWITSF